MTFATTTSKRLCRCQSQEGLFCLSDAARSLMSGHMQTPTIFRDFKFGSRYT